MERRKENQNENAKAYLIPLSKGFAVGVVSFFLLLLAAAFIVGKIKPSPSVLSGLLIPVLILAGFLGGFVAAKSYGQKGLFLGGAAGGMLGVIELLAALLVSGAFPPPEVWVKGMILLISGMIGGYFGVNQPKRRRRKK